MSQPLDVALFRKIKTHWRQHLIEHTRKTAGKVPVTLSNFPKIFIPVLLRSLAQSKQAIQNGIKETGLYPF